MQYAVTPKLNVQAELRTRGTEHGNLLLDFDRDSPNPTIAKDPFLEKNRYRRDLEENIARFGARYAISPRQDIITSAMYLDRQEDFTRLATEKSNHQSLLKDQGYQSETQYQYRGDRFNVTAGGGIYQVHLDQNNILKRVDGSPPRKPCDQGRDDVDTGIFCKDDLNRERVNGYLYSNYNLRSNLNATVGFSYDSYGERAIDFGRFNPKFGLQWDVVSNLRLRAAWFETVKSALIANQTLEPTQIAGFNQLFDDISGTKSRRMGIGMDTHYANMLYGGFEVSQRDLDVPLEFYNPDVRNHQVEIQKQKENLYRSYLYWPISNQWVLRGEGQFERFSRDNADTQPHQIDTISAPVSISYFGSQGLFTSVIGTYVNQKVDRVSPSLIYEGSKQDNVGRDGFFLLDTVLGLRLPNRRGILSFEVRNLLDEQFLYRNANFYVSEATNPRYLPVRTMFLRATFNF